MGEMRGLLRGARIDPKAIRPETTLTELVDGAFLAYNGARLREACQLFTQRLLDDDVTIGLSISGALTPAGLGMSALIPLVEAGFVDWIVSTGANLYHDTHFGIGLSLHRGRPDLNDVLLRQDEVVRIYDIVFDYKVLLDTDAFYRKILFTPQFQREMGTAEFHHLIGEVVAERQKALGLEKRSLVAACWEHGVPVYTSSPGDSSIGMNVAALAIEGCQLRLDISRDVNETAAIVLGAKRAPGRSAAVILGGGSPKNFLLQTEPQVQEVLGIEEKGHDFFLQFTDARVDTGGLSGATPSEAVSWGKIDPDQLDDSVVCYVDSTVALPLITAYALGTREPRPLKRPFDGREAMLATLQSEYLRARASRDERAHEADAHEHRAAVVGAQQG